MAPLEFALWVALVSEHGHFTLRRWALESEHIHLTLRHMLTILWLGHRERDMMNNHNVELPRGGMVAPKFPPQKAATPTKEGGPLNRTQTGRKRKNPKARA